MTLKRKTQITDIQRVKRTGINIEREKKDKDSRCIDSKKDRHKNRKGDKNNNLSSHKNFIHSNEWHSF